MSDLLTFDSPLKLFYGLLAGLVFGFLLQRGGVTRYAVIVGQFLWKDHTVVKTMLTAVAVGAVGVWAMHQMWDVPLHVKNATIAASALGGGIFGVGMALLGYCPGTAVGAVGEGSRHAVPGLIGMLLGAAAFAEIQPHITGLIKTWDLGKVTFADVTGLSIWLFVAAVVLLTVIIAVTLRGKHKPTAT